MRQLLTGFLLWRQYWRHFWGSFLRGHISLKNQSYRPLLRASTSPFKSTCLLIKLKQAKVALYVVTDCVYMPIRTWFWKSNPSQRSPEVQNRTRHVYYGERCATTENIYFHLYSDWPTYVEYRNTRSTSPNCTSLEPRGSRTTVQPVLPIRNNHYSLRKALHYFLRGDPFLKYLTRVFC
jgi:hypothetical protein